MDGSAPTTAVDHLVYATPSLQDTVDHLMVDWGIELVPGGAHLGRGTRNWLAGLGGGTYLEVIGPDAAQPAPRAPRQFGIDDLVAPRLVAWCVRPDRTLADVVRDVAMAGGDLGVVVAMSRQRPDGVLLSWELPFAGPLTNDHNGGIVPFCIDWLGSEHPSLSLTGTTALEAVQLVHPSPVGVERILQTMGIAVPVMEGPTSLRALLHTPRGRLTLQ